MQPTSRMCFFFVGENRGSELEKVHGNKNQTNIHEAIGTYTQLNLNLEVIQWEKELSIEQHFFGRFAATTTRDKQSAHTNFYFTKYR